MIRIKTISFLILLVMLNNQALASSCSQCLKESCLFSWFFKKNQQNLNTQENLEKALDRSHDSTPATPHNFRHCKAPSPERSQNNSPIGSPTNKQRIDLSTRIYPTPPPLVEANHRRQYSEGSFEYVEAQNSPQIQPKPTTKSWFPW